MFVWCMLYAPAGLNVLLRQGGLNVLMRQMAVAVADAVAFDLTPRLLLPCTIVLRMLTNDQVGQMFHF